MAHARALGFGYGSGPLGVGVLWCVGALAPWFAQGAGQLRRQGGSTYHPPRPVIAASAVVLTRPPVPTPTPETTALAAPASSLLHLSPPSPPLAFFLCRRRSSPLPLPPWSLLPVFSFVAVISPASRPLLVSPLCRRRLPAAATAGAQRHRRWDRRRCRQWARGWRRPRRCVPPPAARSCASTCPRRRTPRCTRACRWRPVRALPARAGAPALVEEGEGDNQQEKRRLQK